MIKHPAIHHCWAQQQGVISFWGLQMAEPGWGRVKMILAFLHFSDLPIHDTMSTYSYLDWAFCLLLLGFFWLVATCTSQKKQIAKWIVCSNPMKNRILAKGSFRKVKLARLRWKLNYHHLPLFIKSMWHWGFKTTTFPIQLRFHGHDKHLQRSISTAQKGSKKSCLFTVIIGATHSRTPLSTVVHRSRHRERFKVMISCCWMLKVELLISVLNATARSKNIP